MSTVKYVRNTLNNTGPNGLLISSPSEKTYYRSTMHVMQFSRIIIALIAPRNRLVIEIED